MKSTEVRDVIYEALILYIDEISAIDSVNEVRGRRAPSDDGELEVVFKDGERCRLLIVRN